MKLFSKYNRVSLIATIIVFLLASLAFLAVLRYTIVRQVDRDLGIERNEIETAARDLGHLPPVIPVRDQYTRFEAEAGPSTDRPAFYTRKNGERHKKQAVREMLFDLNIRGNWYLVTVGKSLSGSNELIQTLIIIIVAAILLMLLATLLINRLLLKNLWRPFFSTLSAVDQFSLGRQQALRLPGSDIDEFRKMNQSLQAAMGKAEKDYMLLREFTENASHELQTPLAIIRSKLDLLIQEENLSQAQVEAVGSAYEATTRLARISEALLLLAKIENKQFGEKSRIDLADLLRQKLKPFEGLWDSRQLEVVTQLQAVPAEMHPALADVLLNNLLGNAVRHTFPGGKIELISGKDSLSITNSGVPQPLDRERLFSRFYKSSQLAEGHGLGLAIVREICESSGCSIEYSFEAPDKHRFILHVGQR